MAGLRSTKTARNDPEFTSEYLKAAFEALDEEGGDRTFLMALRHIVEAKGGMAVVAKKAELSRESLYRALSPKGNPTLKTLRQVVHATGFSLTTLAPL